MVIASASRSEDPGFESRQGELFLGLKKVLAPHHWLQPISNVTFSYKAQFSQFYMALKHLMQNPRLLSIILRYVYIHMLFLSGNNVVQNYVCRG
jgi:hypothetical protein